MLVGRVVASEDGHIELDEAGGASGAPVREQPVLAAAEDIPDVELRAAEEQAAQGRQEVAFANADVNHCCESFFCKIVLPLAFLAFIIYKVVKGFASA